MVLASHARKYKLTTKAKSNAWGRWFGVKFQDLGYVSKAEYDLARELHKIAERGAYRVELSIQNSTAPEAA